MSNGRTVHVVSDGPIEGSFIDVVLGNFHNQQHLFLITRKSGIKNTQTYTHANSIHVLDVTDRKRHIYLLNSELNNAKKIILHGLFDMQIVFLLLFQPWLFKKTYWVIWGSDLYFYESRVKSLKTNLVEVIRAQAIKKFGHLVTFINGDYERAQKWYGARGKYHECIMYPSNIYRPLLTRDNDSNTIHIQIGNSADPKNNHHHLLEKLAIYKEQNIKIFAPLSYGDKAYANEIALLGKEIFAEKFIPMMEFMPADAYSNFLGSIDIALFYHKNQQAMGNTIKLLGLGAKVYMRQDVSPWQFFQEKGIHVFDIDTFVLDTFSKKMRNENIAAVTSYFSEDNMCLQLTSIFGGS